MTSKELILKNIKENNIVKEVPLPSYDNFGIKFEDKFQTFSTMIESVGGKALLINKSDLDKTIKELYPDEKQIASNVEFCNVGNFNANEQEDVHTLKDIDLAVVKGNFAIAENGAIWMKDEENRHRALYFIAQNIVIVIDEKDILNNMHEAYQKLNFDNNGYGVFISGPSKTADIEQSLVIGAHGPKSGYVIFTKS
ncbi:L-lactate utilization protein LutC [Arcobacter acticola]|jgi:L-lactate dehydrogenase complex protein LldG|uniref:L-lactate utilization protein LutC n=1 Tax=Arcobacter acticola TaxID=1849015 RepID=A0A6M8EVP0_9BACT|nr:LUD domain-containing protein [Arcobacter acticola]QKE27344.1 L-lactate utilization protein LutC [Arcobacter acticola]